MKDPIKESWKTKQDPIHPRMKEFTIPREPIARLVGIVMVRQIQFEMVMLGELHKLLRTGF